MTDKPSMHLMGLISEQPATGRPVEWKVLPGGDKRIRQPEANGTGASSGKAPATGCADVSKLEGVKLGMSVASEVMGWRLDHDEYTDSWIDSEGKLTGYYYGRPFSPYRDRNALNEVWERVESINLRAVYLDELRQLLAIDEGGSEDISAWALHTCPPDIACRAAILAVRGMKKNA